MKLAHVFFVASTAVLLGVAACASPATQEETGSTSQALCMKGQTCQTSSGTSIGGSTSSSSSSGWVFDPGTSTSSSSGSTTPTVTCGSDTFTCSGAIPDCDENTSYKKTTSDPCNLTVRCQTTNGEEWCDCVPGCGGGGYTFGGWNPCMYGRTYRCDSNGYCTCS